MTMSIAPESELRIDADSETDLTEFLPLVHEALADDWDAHGMELYDDYDANRPAS